MPHITASTITSVPRSSLHVTEKKGEKKRKRISPDVRARIKTSKIVTLHIDKWIFRHRENIVINKIHSQRQHERRSKAAAPYLSYFFCFLSLGVGRELAKNERQSGGILVHMPEINTHIGNSDRNISNLIKSWKYSTRSFSNWWGIFAIRRASVHTGNGNITTPTTTSWVMRIHTFQSSCVVDSDRHRHRDREPLDGAEGSPLSLSPWRHVLRQKYLVRKGKALLGNSSKI